MINLVIIEDEKPAFENLSRLLEKNTTEVNLVAWLRSVSEAKNWFAENRQPDLIFLDIQLSDGKSFAIFEDIEIHCPVIFTTAYDEFALKAFELNSVDYLLKPLSQQKIDKAVDKYLVTRGGLQSNQSLAKSYTKLAKTLRDYQRPHTLLAKSGGNFTKLPVTHIQYLYSDEAVFCVADNGRTYSLKGSLGQIEDELASADFYRINRKIIVNRSAIVSISRQLTGKVSVNLKHNPAFSVHVSKERAKHFKQWFEG